MIMNGADGTGATSGILKAPNKAKMLEEMVQAIAKAKKAEKNEIMEELR